MPGFDSAWFDELGRIDQGVIDQCSVDPNLHHPSDVTLADANRKANNALVLPVFFSPLRDARLELVKRRFAMALPYRVTPHHLYQYNYGASWARQWSYAFTSEEKDRHARIGLGFSLSQWQTRGHEAYWAFTRQRPSVLTASFSKLAGTLTIETENGYATGQDVVGFVANDQIPDDGWRFFGLHIHEGDPSLSSVDAFVSKCEVVFRHIASGGAA